MHWSCAQGRSTHREDVVRAAPLSLLLLLQGLRASQAEPAATAVGWLLLQRIQGRRPGDGPRRRGFLRSGRGGAHEGLRLGEGDADRLGQLVLLRLLLPLLLPAARRTRRLESGGAMRGGTGQPPVLLDITRVDVVPSIVVIVVKGGIVPRGPAC